MLKFKELPDEDKPRERLLLNGASTLSNEELLMIILKTGTKKYSVKELANTLLTECGSIYNLKNMTVPKLMEINGIGKIKAIELVAVIELSNRIFNDVPKFNLLNCTNPISIIEHFNYLFKDVFQEEFYVLYLNNKKKFLDKKKLFIGSISMSIVHPREIFKEAYLLSASFIICIHNHPSGDPTPSNEDIAITKNLKSIGEMHAIYLIDHLIIGKDCYYSFHENNFILNTK